MSETTSRPFVRLPRKWRVIVLLAVCLAPFALAEVAARIYYAAIGHGNPERFKEYVYLPYISYFTKPFGKRLTTLEMDRYGFTLNRLGNQDRDLKNKAEDEFRIFIFGGSSTQGRYLTGPQDTISSRLERALSKNFADDGIALRPKVINAGVSGYFSAMEFNLFNFVVTRLKPDYVIFFNGGNDFTQHYRKRVGDSPILELMDYNFPPYFTEFLDSYNNMFSIGGLILQFSKIMPKYSAAWRYGEENYRRLLNKFDKEKARVKRIFGAAHVRDYILDQQNQINVSHRRYLHNMTSAIGVARQRGIGIAVILQPLMLHGGVNYSDKEKAIARNKVKGTLPNQKNYLVRREEFLRLTERSLADMRRDNVKFSDVSIESFMDIFKAKSPDTQVFGDDIHYTNAGREIIVKNLIKRLGPQIMRQAKAGRARLN